VLIVSSLTVVLAHWAIGRGEVRRATMFVGVTLALGIVFLGIKAVEYKAKYDHDILPGHVGDNLEGPQAQWYKDRVRGQLTEITQHPEHFGLTADSAAVKASATLLDDMDDKMIPNDPKDPSKGGTYRKAMSAVAVGEEVNELVEKYEGLHLSPYIR